MSTNSRTLRLSGRSQALSRAGGTVRPSGPQPTLFSPSEGRWGREERRGEERGQGRRHRAGEPSPGPKEAAAARPAVTT